MTVTKDRRGPVTIGRGVGVAAAGACLVVVLSGCSLDVESLGEHLSTHWAGVGSPSASPSASPAPASSTMESSPVTVP